LDATDTVAMFKSRNTLSWIGQLIELEDSSEIYPDIPLGILRINGSVMQGLYLQTPILPIEDYIVVSRFQKGKLVKLNDGTRKKYSFALQAISLTSKLVFTHKVEFALIRPISIDNGRIFYSEKMYPKEEIASGSVLFPSSSFELT
jgi:hypothetical protein